MSKNLRNVSASDIHETCLALGFIIGFSEILGKFSFDHAEDDGYLVADIKRACKKFPNTFWAEHTLSKTNEYVHQKAPSYLRKRLDALPKKEADKLRAWIKRRDSK
jgi:hypothetical protein